MAFRFGTQRSLGLPIGGGGGTILKPQDVFATSLYTGNGSSRAIATGIDMVARGGLAWEKTRGVADDHYLADTLRGGGKSLSSNTTGAEATGGFGATPTSTGFNSSPYGNLSVVGWSFARASKFFDIVTWTGDGTSNRQIPHGLGVVPGMIVIKSRSATGNWPVWHRSTGDGNYMLLDTTQASSAFPHVSATSSTTFTLGAGNHANSNASGVTYVAYLFAHDPSADGIVQCGVSNADGAGTFVIEHEWAGGAQWIMHKRTDAASDWRIFDTARTPGFSGPDAYLAPNLSAAEGSAGLVSQSGGVLSITAVPGGVYAWAIIRAPY